MKWQKKIVLASQERLAAESAEHIRRYGQERLLPQLTAELQQLEAVGDPATDLRRFHLTLAALRHHLSYGGLRPAEIRQLTQLAAGLLQANGIKAGSSRLSFLHADLQVIAGRLQERKGGHWAAAWQHAGALGLAAKSERQHTNRLHLQLAKSLLRLGDAAAALQHLDLAEAGPGDDAAGAAPAAVDQATAFGVWSCRARALLYSGRESALRDLIAAKQLGPAIDGQARRLCLWLKAVLALITAASPGAVLKCVGRGGSHPEMRAQLEASLWFRCLADPQWTPRLSLVRSLGRKPAFKAAKDTLLYKAALTLEQCDDPAVPLGVRLGHLGEILAAARRLALVEHELLVWAAAARFLSRSKQLPAAALALREYAALSRRLGPSADALGTVQDLLDKPWFI